MNNMRHNSKKKRRQNKTNDMHACIPVTNDYIYYNKLTETSTYPNQMATVS